MGMNFLIIIFIKKYHVTIFIIKKYKKHTLTQRTTNNYHNQIKAPKSGNIAQKITKKKLKIKTKTRT